MKRFTKSASYDKWELVLVGLMIFLLGVFIEVLLALNITHGQ